MQYIMRQKCEINQLRNCCRNIRQKWCRQCIKRQNLEVFLNLKPNVFDSMVITGFLHYNRESICGIRNHCFRCDQVGSKWKFDLIIGDQTLLKMQELMRKNHDNLVVELFLLRTIDIINWRSCNKDIFLFIKAL